MSGARRAFTLLEVVVAGALLAMLVVIMANLLLPTIRAGARASTRAQLQEQAMLAMGWISTDLAATIPGGLGLRFDPTVLSVQPARDLSFEGMVVWETWLVVYYLDSGSRTLYRRTWKSPGPPSLDLALSSSTPCRPSSSDLLELGTQLDGSQRVLATNVDAFEVTHAGLGDSIAGPLRVQLSLSKTAVGFTSPETHQIQRTVSLRMAE